VQVAPIQLRMENSTTRMDANASGEEEGEAWRKIDRSTKAGRMLARIYGGKKPTINYPKVRRRKDAGTAQRRKFGAATTKTQRSNHVNVPIPVPAGSSMSSVRYPLPNRPMRKPRAEIEREMKQQRRAKLAERPVPLRKGISTAAEKLRLQQQFQFGGGKALPSKLLPHDGGQSYAAVGTVRNLTQDAQVTRARGAITRRETERAERALAASGSGEDEALFKELVREIAERSAFLKEMRELKQLSAAKERGIEREIEARISKMRTLKAKLERSALP